VAIAVAALLGTLAPPVAGSTSSLIGLAASGNDIGDTVHVRLSTLSNEPGSNRFVAQVTESRISTLIVPWNGLLMFSPRISCRQPPGTLPPPPLPHIIRIG
jgi:hypothetical protein